MQENPSLVVGVVTAAIGAVFALLLAYGIGISPDQQTAWLNAAVVFTPLVVGAVNWYLNRRKQMRNSNPRV